MGRGGVRIARRGRARRRAIAPAPLPGNMLLSRRDIERHGRRVLAATLDNLFEGGRRRVFSGATAAELERTFAAPLPERGKDPRTVLRAASEKFMRHSLQTSHPRMFGLLCPAPLPVAALAEIPVTLLNQSLDIWKCGPAGTHLEIQLIRWFNDLIGFGRKSFGVFTSGGGIANTIAMKMARDRVTGIRGRRSGLPAALVRRLRVYASEQAHFSIARALDILGIGEGALVRVPCDESMRMRPQALAAAIARDRRRRLIPMAVVATAGTTSSGSIDPVAEISRIARREGMHCHVDAAYGGALLFSNRYRERLAGLEGCDTVTVDPHKWLFQPFSLGGLFVRDGAALRASFRVEPGYLRKDLEPDRRRLDFYHYSMEGSRRFRGLKLWFTLETLGRRGLGDLVDRTMDVAAHLEDAVRRQDCFEPLFTPVDLATVCFRYLPPWARRASPAARMRRPLRARLDRVQKIIQQRIEKGGEAWFPTVSLPQGVFFRFGIFNYLTDTDDIDAVLRLILRTARSLGH